MKFNRKYILLFFAVVFCVCTTFAKPQEDNEELSEIVQVDTLTISSKILGYDIKTVVVLPAQYFEAEMEEERYPVVYLLHGYAGDYSNWVKKYETLDQVADDSGFIFVCPDGKQSWYWDSPINKDSQFESYITKELVPYIDSQYRTVAKPNMRAITGLSMGGHGALWLAMRHSDIFGVCGSMSGGVDIRPFPNKWKMKEQLGEYEDNKAVWDSHTVINLVPTLKKGQLKIIFDCGVDDFFYQVNLNLHNALLKQGIDHDFISRPGRHTWEYWVNSLDYQLLFFQKALGEATEAE